MYNHNKKIVENVIMKGEIKKPGFLERLSSFIPKKSEVKSERVAQSSENTDTNASPDNATKQKLLCLTEEQINRMSNTDIQNFLERTYQDNIHILIEGRFSLHNCTIKSEWLASSRRLVIVESLYLLSCEITGRGEFTQVFRSIPKDQINNRMIVKSENIGLRTEIITFINCKGLKSFRPLAKDMFLRATSEMNTVFIGKQLEFIDCPDLERIPFSIKVDAFFSLKGCNPSILSGPHHIQAGTINIDSDILEKNENNEALILKEHAHNLREDD